MVPVTPDRAWLESLVGAAEAARILAYDGGKQGVTKLARSMAADGEPVGRLMPGVGWVFTPGCLLRMAERRRYRRHA